MEQDFRNLLDGTSSEEMDWDAAFDEAPELTQAQHYFLGMTPQQRFVLSLLFLIMVCMLGTLCMLVTERMVLPF